jgi:GntR family transcriptional regulator, transcriptional repressor for pyruvate dehydrogenase complex
VREAVVKVVPVAQRSAAGAVRSQLIALIEANELPVGERLPSEAELAASFAVSRSVIREALHSLNALGLTKSYAGRGTFVAATHAQSQLLIGRYEPWHLNEVRLALEVPSARNAAVRRVDEDLTELLSLANKFSETTDADERSQVDADFHTAIASASGNPLFARLVTDLRAVLRDQARQVAAAPGRQAQAAREHMEIYEAIAAGDADAAGQAMERHLGAVITTNSQLRGND